MQQNRAMMRAALAPTGHAHPLIPTASQPDIAARIAAALANPVTPYDTVEATAKPAGHDDVLAALPGAVDEAMRRTLPGKYTPELAAAVAQDMITNLERSRLIRGLKGIHERMVTAGLGSPELDAFSAEIIRQVSAAQDPAATYDAILQLMRDHRAGATT